MIGCAVFMGCPIKTGLRLAAGDVTALAGAAGLVAGVFLGAKFLEGGFATGRAAAQPAPGGYIVPAIMAALLAAAVADPAFVASSVKGAAAQRAPLLASLAIGLAAGALAQRTGFCVTGGVARAFVWGRDLPGCPRSAGMLAGVGAFLESATVASVIAGGFDPGVVGQPSSNEDWGWGFLAMLAVGLGSILIRGCPFRQLVLAGSGDHDAGGAVLGMLTGAALVQSWGLAGDAAGTPAAGKVAVLAGLAFLLAIGIAYRDRS
jgi:YedE family putative selenium metabolism protein